jgi:hypothetical protein
VAGAGGSALAISSTHLNPYSTSTGHTVHTAASRAQAHEDPVFRSPSAHHELLQMLYMLRTFNFNLLGSRWSSFLPAPFARPRANDGALLPLWGHERRTRCCRGGWSQSQSPSPCDDHENGGKRGRCPSRAGASGPAMHKAGVLGRRDVQWE